MYPSDLTYQQIESIKNNFHNVYITVTPMAGTNQSVLNLETKNIVQGTFNLNRYCVTGSRVEVGTCVASQVSFTLDNSNGDYSSYIFEGAELNITIKVKDSDGSDIVIPVGHFTVDEPPRRLSQIKITALDSMMQFDKVADLSGMTPISSTSGTDIGKVIEYCCQKCNVSFDYNNYPYKTSDDGNFIVYLPLTIEKETTYRQILSDALKVLMASAYISPDNELVIRRFGDTEGWLILISDKDRYTSDIYENRIEVTGFLYSDEYEKEHVYGTDDYAFDLSGNMFLKGVNDPNNSTISTYVNSNLSNIYNKAIYKSSGNIHTKIYYTPFKCTTKPLPFLFPMDCISYSYNRKGLNEFIFEINYVLNGKTTISAKGDTSVQNSYASVNPLTIKEKQVIDSISLTAKEEAAINMNQFIGNSLGLYTHIETDEVTGAKTYYFHDKSDIAQSDFVYTFNSGGMVWAKSIVTTSGNKIYPWQGEGGKDTVWQYGFLGNGNAVFNELYANRITTEFLATNAIQSPDFSYNQNSGDLFSNKGSFFDLSNGDIITPAFSVLHKNLNGTTSDVANSFFKGTIVSNTISSNEYIKNSGNRRYIGNLNFGGEYAFASGTGYDLTMKNQYLENGTYYTSSSASLFGAFDGEDTSISLKVSKYNDTDDSSFESISSIGITNNICSIENAKLDIYYGSNYDKYSDIEYLKFGIYGRNNDLSIGYDYVGTDENGPYGNTYIVSDNNICIGKTETDNNLKGSWTCESSFESRILKVKAYGHNDANNFHIAEFRDDDNSQNLLIFGHDRDNGMGEYTMIRADGNRYLRLGCLGQDESNKTNVLAGTWANDGGSIITSSDRRLKNSIKEFDSRYSKMFDLLIPKLFKYNVGESDRYHAGFIAQELDDAMYKAGISRKEFAGLCISAKDTPEESWGIRYEEIIPILTYEIQNLKKRIKELERKNEVI